MSVPSQRQRAKGANKARFSIFKGAKIKRGREVEVGRERDRMTRGMVVVEETRPRQMGAWARQMGQQCCRQGSGQRGKGAYKQMPSPGKVWACHLPSKELVGDIQGKGMGTLGCGHGNKRYKGARHYNGPHNGAGWGLGAVSPNLFYNKVPASGTTLHIYIYPKGCSSWQVRRKGVLKPGNGSIRKVGAWLATVCLAASSPRINEPIWERE